MAQNPQCSQNVRRLQDLFMILKIIFNDITMQFSSILIGYVTVECTYRVGLSWKWIGLKVEMEGEGYSYFCTVSYTHLTLPTTPYV